LRRRWRPAAPHLDAAHPGSGHRGRSLLFEENNISTYSADGTGAREVTDVRVDKTNTSETKPSTKTSEFFVYLAAVVAVAITALVVGDDGGGDDPFSAARALKYITALSIGYMLARGIAKAGSYAKDTSNSPR
jgi:hypothetical protein